MYNIYTDVTKELRKSEFDGLDANFKNKQNNRRYIIVGQ